LAWQELEPEAAEARPQVLAPKVPPAPPSLQVIVPVGAEGAADESVTVAVNVIEPPAVTAAGLGDTELVVGWGGWLTVNEEVPALVECVESPG
jgi:hypothetical protein